MGRFLGPPVFGCKAKFETETSSTTASVLYVDASYTKNDNTNPAAVIANAPVNARALMTVRAINVLRFFVGASVDLAGASMETCRRPYPDRKNAGQGRR